MKIGIFSDIHGNREPFDIMMNIFKRERIKKIIFCGDLMGYYYEQNYILNILKNIDDLIMVLGNHDYDFLNKYKFNYDVYVKNNKNKNFLSKENFMFLKNKKIEETLEIYDKKIKVIHGGINDNISEYMYPDYDFEANFKDKIELELDYLFYGNTHYRMVKELENLKIINPGSLGQPRDGNYPSFCILNIENGEILYHDILYDRSKLKEKLKLNASNENIKYKLEVLYRGW